MPNRLRRVTSTLPRSRSLSAVADAVGDRDARRLLDVDDAGCARSCDSGSISARLTRSKMPRADRRRWLSSRRSRPSGSPSLQRQLAPHHRLLRVLETRHHDVVDVDPRAGRGRAARRRRVAPSSLRARPRAPRRRRDSRRRGRRRAGSCGRGPGRARGRARPRAAAARAARSSRAARPARRSSRCRRHPPARPARGRARADGPRRPGPRPRPSPPRYPRSSSARASVRASVVGQPVAQRRVRRASTASAGRSALAVRRDAHGLDDRERTGGHVVHQDLAVRARPRSDTRRPPAGGRAPGAPAPAGRGPPRARRSRRRRRGGGGRRRVRRRGSGRGSPASRRRSRAPGVTANSRRTGAGRRVVGLAHLHTRPPVAARGASARACASAACACASARRKGCPRRGRTRPLQLDHERRGRALDASPG